MIIDSSEFKKIVDELDQKIKFFCTDYTETRRLNPTFEQVYEDSFNEKEARIWIYGATDIRESNPIEEWLFRYPSPSETQKGLALNHYDAWCVFIREEGVYADFTGEHLLKPEGNESLESFIYRLAGIVEKSGWGTKKEKRALNSFLGFLRRTKSLNEVAFIEHIFPESKDLRGGRIIRKVRPQVAAISQRVAANVIKALAYQCAYGRKNACHHAAEALAFIWLCLSASRIRWHRSLEMVHATKTTAILCEREFPELLVPSDFGDEKVRISKAVANFLRAVASIPSESPRKTILQTSIEDLRKPLRTAIKKANPPQNIGEITFLSFLSTPHHCGENIR